MNTEEPELLEQTAEILGGGGTIDLEQLQALHAAAQDGEPVVVHFKLRRDLEQQAKGSRPRRKTTCFQALLYFRPSLREARF